MKTHISSERFDYFNNKIEKFIWNNSNDINSLFNIYKENKFRLKYPADYLNHIISDIYDDSVKTYNRVPSKNVFLWYIDAVISESVFASDWFQGLDNEKDSYSCYDGMWSKFSPKDKKITIYFTNDPRRENIGYDEFCGNETINKINDIFDRNFTKDDFHFGDILNLPEYDPYILLWQNFDKKCMYEIKELYRYEIDLSDLIEYQDRKTLFDED